MLSCHEVTRLVSESRERKLALSEQMSLKMHLVMCKACRQFGNQLGFLHDTMRAYALGKDKEQDE